MNPLLKWPGGKSRKAKILISILPDHETYIEPFAGGMSVLLNKKPAKVEVAGDMSPWLAPFYDSVRRGSLDKCSPMRNVPGAFEIVRGKAKEGQATACDLLNLNKASFHGGMTSPERKSDSKPVSMEALRNLPRFKARLRGVHLRIADFEDTMRRWDSPTTVHYLDPPYCGGRADSYSKKYGEDVCERVPVERVARVAAEMEGKVVVSYEDTPEARKAFQKADLRVYRLRTKRSAAGRGMVPVTELVVTNFEVPSKLRSRSRS